MLAVSNERHLKISIGSQLGEKAGIGHEYAAAQFHRITFGGQDFFFPSLQYFHSFIALCSYPLVKMDIRDSTIWKSKGPVFTQFCSKFKNFSFDW